MAIHSAHITKLDIQGLMSVAVYVNYFLPGSLKIRSVVLIPENRSLESLPLDTRRWLQQTESPYPGYCRAPGSDKCLPLLCDCKKLTKIWTTIKETKDKLKLNDFNTITQSVDGEFSTLTQSVDGEFST